MSERFLGGRKAWVTGGVTGIGRAIALGLAEAGADVAIGSLPADHELPDAAYAARPRTTEIEETAEAIRSHGARCFAMGFDLREEASLAAFYARATEALGHFDILVNAAGVSAQEAMIRHRDETWTTVLDINLNGSYKTIKRCFPGMVERRWGRIINIASTAADAGHPRYGAYCASKSALLGLTRCVALEGAEHGVTCNALNPGSVGTEMMRLGALRRIAQRGEEATVEEDWAGIAESMPQKRLIPPEEIAVAAVFLCRDDAFGITGETITISGGALW
jgi:3-hydroxybutyrate dehydrogenase